MAKYLCDLLHMDRIAAMEVIEAEDAAALLEVDKVLELSSCPCAELWDRDRQASIIS
jgi:hypothetical protein